MKFDDWQFYNDEDFVDHFVRHSMFDSGSDDTIVLAALMNYILMGQNSDNVALGDLVGGLKSLEEGDRTEGANPFISIDNTIVPRTELFHTPISLSDGSIDIYKNSNHPPKVIFTELLKERFHQWYCDMFDEEFEGSYWDDEGRDVHELFELEWNEPKEISFQRIMITEEYYFYAATIEFKHLDSRNNITIVFYTLK